MRPTEERGGAGAGTIESAPAQTVLQVDRISKSFGPIPAVRDLSFEALPGEIIGLLGPNGAGKTTAIRVLSTILPPTRGSFTLGDVPHTKSQEIRRQIGVLPESAGYPLHLTGDEFLRYHARLFGHSARAARNVAASLLSEVGLSERATSLIGAYSRGMRQRLGVARALVNQPRVIFLDEPTLGLDPAGQRQILGLIRDVARERGTLVILSTHFMNEVEETCSRVIILNRGEGIAEGTVPDIKRMAAPRTARVRVAADRHELACAVLNGTDGVATVDSVDGERGSLTATFERTGLEGRPDAGVNTVIRCLTDAEIPVLSFELEGGRLSDAFLLLTEESSS